MSWVISPPACIMWRYVCREAFVSQVPLDYHFTQPVYICNTLSLCGLEMMLKISSEDSNDQHLELVWLRDDVEDLKWGFPNSGNPRLFNPNPLHRHLPNITRAISTAESADFHVPWITAWVYVDSQWAHIYLRLYMDSQREHRELFCSHCEMRC